MSSQTSKTQKSQKLEGVLQRINEQMYERNVELTVKNTTLSLQREMYEVINTTRGLEDTAEALIHVITKQLNFRGGSVLLMNREENTLDVLATTSARKHPRKANVPVLKRLNKMRFKLSDKKNLAVHVAKHNRKRVTRELHDLLLPFVSVDESRKIQKQLQAQTFVVYSINFAGKTLGVLILALDRLEKDLTRTEKEALESIIDVVGIAIEQARIYSALKNANRRLKELDKMKDNFVSVASHELRTPMTAIKSYLWMALEGKGGKLKEKQKYYLLRSYKSTDRLIKLVNDMLNISRIESGRISVSFDKVNVKELVLEVMEEVKPRAQELRIKTKIIDNKITSPIAVADEDKIKEVLFNLIGNSLKFTDPEGTVTIGLSKEDENIRIAITDTGRGIDAKDMPTLFRKFGMIEGSYASNKKASGTGLGLYISKAILDLHGGTIDVQSDGIGKGSTFSFTLPVFTEKTLSRMKRKQKKGTVGIVHSGF